MEIVRGYEEFWQSYHPIKTVLDRLVRKNLITEPSARALLLELES